MKTRKNKGFTLVELMVVIVILGILATIVAVNVGGFDEEANEAKARAEVKAIYDAISLYKLRSPDRDYPDDLQALVDGPPDFEGTWRPLLPKIPMDPWGREYEFEIDEVKGPIVRCPSRDSGMGNRGPLKDISYPEESDSGY